MFDARGHLALVGFSPQAHVADTFPTTVAPSLIMLVDDAEEASVLVPGGAATVRVVVTNDDGEVVFYVEQAAQIGGPKDASGLPGRFSLVAQFPVTAAKAGQFRYSVTLTFPGGEQVQQEARLRVVDQAWLDERKAQRSHAP
ncbi:hypothetical protein EDE04_3261 [Streptomyces sp. 2132.2]|nr:hypothetical protein EDE04_3261 [Streptomyces sp. 2132.2]